MVWGMWTLENFGSSLLGISVALLTHGLEWTTEELEIFLADVGKDIKSPRSHAYWPK